MSAAVPLPHSNIFELRPTFLAPACPRDLPCCGQASLLGGNRLDVLAQERIAFQLPFESLEALARRVRHIGEFALFYALENLCQGPQLQQLLRDELAPEPRNQNLIDVRCPGPLPMSGPPRLPSFFTNSCSVDSYSFPGFFC